MLDCDEVAVSVDLTIKMCKEIDAKKDSVREKKEKDHNRNKRMLAHEEQVVCINYILSYSYNKIV